MPVKAAAKIRENFDTNTTIDQVKRQEKTMQEVELQIAELNKNSQRATKSIDELKKEVASLDIREELKQVQDMIPDEAKIKDVASKYVKEQAAVKEPMAESAELNRLSDEVAKLAAEKGLMKIKL